jgi:hypothetical protein
LRAILSVLRCRPGDKERVRVVWFSTREEPISKFTFHLVWDTAAICEILFLMAISLCVQSLSFDGCPISHLKLSIVYISGRPFVLRDASEPRKTLALSDRAENLEAIEQRLKADILVEATKFVPVIRYSQRFS